MDAAGLDSFHWSESSEIICSTSEPKGADSSPVGPRSEADCSAPDPLPATTGDSCITSRLQAAYMGATLPSTGVEGG